MFRKLFIANLLLALLSITPVSAHGGRLDANGGHNCRTGSCAGTYHCHKPLSDYCKRELGISTKKNKKK